jgi:hypothetical protein
MHNVALLWLKDKEKARRTGAEPVLPNILFITSNETTNGRP